MIGLNLTILISGWLCRWCRRAWSGPMSRESPWSTSTAPWPARPPWSTGRSNTALWLVQSLTVLRCDWCRAWQYWAVIGPYITNTDPWLAAGSWWTGAAPPGWTPRSWRWTPPRTTPAPCRAIWVSVGFIINYQLVFTWWLTRMSIWGFSSILKMILFQCWLIVSWWQTIQHATLLCCGFFSTSTYDFLRTVIPS